MKAILSIFGGLLFVTVAAIIQTYVQGFNKPSIPEPTPTPQVQVYNGVTCPSDYSSYLSLRQKSEQVVPLISGKKVMFAKNGKFVNNQVVITKNDTKESKVACGYLYVKVGTDDYGPLRSWENININPNDFGGHISSENQIGPGDGRKYSEYLFLLNKIEYWKTKNRGTLLTADWAALLNVSDTVKFEIALNTNDTTGFIDELSLAYKCWNPLTGEENNGCKLNITSNEDKLSDKPLQ